MLLNEDKIEPSKCYISARVLRLLTHLRQPVGEPRNAGQYKSHADRSIHQGPFRIARPPNVTASAPVPITKRLPFLFSHNFIILRLKKDNPPTCGVSLNRLPRIGLVCFVAPVSCRICPIGHGASKSPVRKNPYMMRQMS